MSGRRAKALRRELIRLLGRAPRGQGENVRTYDGTGIMTLPKSEWRVYKHAYMRTRATGPSHKPTR